MIASIDRTHLVRWTAALIGLILLAACSPSPVGPLGPAQAPPRVPGGDPGRGVGAIQGYGCGGCHTIPGVQGANATVGPPLTAFSRRAYIAGQLPNTTENLIAWIMNPQAIEPGTAMPNLNVSEEAARDIAAYLYTLQ